MFLHLQFAIFKADFTSLGLAIFPEASDLCQLLQFFFLLVPLLSDLFASHAIDSIGDHVILIVFEVLSEHLVVLEQLLVDSGELLGLFILLRILLVVYFVEQQGA